MANKTIRLDNRPTIQNSQSRYSVNSVSEAVNACSLKAAENDRLTTSLIDGLHTLNSKLIELDNALKLAYGNA
jgi:hypothetical protein